VSGSPVGAWEVGGSARFNPNGDRLFGPRGKTDPGLVESFHFLGMRLLESSRRSDAAVAFEKTTIVDPLHAQSWLKLGRIYLGPKGAEAAFRYFQRATNAAPESAEAQ